MSGAGGAGGTGGTGGSAAPATASMFAVELLAELIRRGVCDVVVCPGSRSQALALAAAAAEQAGAIRLHVRLDERSAAFFALGVARETGVPAPIIVTSGTAVANLTAAVMEAHEARVPMILLTADRPSELRGIRSNQTTAQAGMFGRFARLSIDVPAPVLGADGDLRRDAAGGVVRDPGALAATALVAARGLAGGAPAGAVQLNLAFTEPLSGTEGFDDMIAAGFQGAAEEAAAATGSAADAAAAADAAVKQAAAGEQPESESYVFGAGAELAAADPDPTPLAVVIAGEGAGPEAEAFAHAAGIPLLAEVVSGARFGREAITGYATLLDDPQLGGLVEQAIVFGHPTLTRQVPALLQRDDVEVVVVDQHAGVDHFNPGRRARVVRSARVAEGHDSRALRRWLGAWVVADRALQRERSTLHEPDLEAALATGYKERNAYARAEVAVMREPVSREMLVEHVWRASWPHDRLVLAASRLVRVLDGLAPARRLEVRANRGLAGIDGTIATALGVASASQGLAGGVLADPALADPALSGAALSGPALSAGTTRVLLGDLALLHDVGSLMLAEGEDRPRIQLFVGNDGGGTIFDGLEVAASASRTVFDRVMYTPQRVSLSALAEAYGWEYRLVSTRGELDQLLTAPVAGPMLVEVPLVR